MKRGMGRPQSSCASCGLYQSVRSPKIPPFGEFRKRIMVVGEAPGAEEDAQGRPWVGRMGQALQREYARLGIDLFRDCISINAVNCRPTDVRGSNRAPTSHEIACCRAKVLQAIQQYEPKTIILHGGTALESLIGHRWSEALGGITKWRGWTIPDREHNAWICPTYHPSYVERQREVSKEIVVIWGNDLRRAFSTVEGEWPSGSSEADCVTIMTDEGEALGALRNILRQRPPLLAFDIETTGLKPYDSSAHEILTIAFCWGEDEAVAMPFSKSEVFQSQLRKLLTHPRIGKVAANMKYEDVWLATLAGIEVRPWAFDTMQAAHVLDNRPGITGLKFQSYVRFGLLGYERAVEAYLRSPDSNTPNRATELLQSPALLRELLLYNGIDALMEYRLAQIQMAELGFSRDGENSDA